MSNSSQLGVLRLGSASPGRVAAWESAPMTDLELLRAELLNAIAQTAAQLRTEFAQADAVVEAQANAYTDAAVASLEAGGPSWILSSFDGSSSGLRIFVSPDASNWELLPDLRYPWPVRDPSIIRYQGKWLLAHTGATGLGKVLDSYRGFWVTSSHDLASWAMPHTIDLKPQIQGVTQVWAPEWFVDPLDDSLHLLFSATTQGTTGFKLYEKHPTDGPLSPWSEARELVITGEINSIDPFVVCKDGIYYLWYKSQSTMFIQVASSPTLYGPYTNVRVGDWAGWGVHQEAPCVVKLLDRWRVFGDNYTQLWYSDSFDDWATWTPKQPIATPSSARHGTVIRS